MKYITFLFVFFFFLNHSFAQKHQAKTLDHIKANKEKYGFTDQDIRDWIIQDNYTTKHNGVEHIYLQQTIQGIPIELSISNINITKEGKILNINNKFISTENKNINLSPSISSRNALNLALQHLNITLDESPRLIKEYNDVKQTATYQALPNAMEDIKSELHILYQGKQGIKLIWKLRIETQNPSFHIWTMYVDARNGEILGKKDNVIHCNFDHPHTASCSESHQHNIPVNLKKPVNKIANNNSFFAPDSYEVFPLRVESPNHGNREVLINPANPVASPFGWHDTNGAAGAEYTYTRGNNVLAQDDQNGNDGSGYRPEGGSSLDFIFTQDLAGQDPTTNAAAENLNSSITNLFVWNNLMHDVWYNYGFDEASGNFQINNYGNGGIGNDYVLADAQDGGGVNNANFSTPQDGVNGRMQMYMWSGTADVDFTVNSPASIAGSYNVRPGAFGDVGYNVTGELQIMDDGSAAPTEGCVTAGIPSFTGKIALIDRGECEFGKKCLDAENKGAIAVIICNNVAGDNIQMGAGADGGNVTIPCVMMSQADCATIRVEIPTVEITMDSSTEGFDKDGSLDNGIISHEYGHGISIRLAGGPGNSGCLGNAEQAGEGWSDFFSLVMTQKESDDRSTVRGIGTYATSTPTDATGIRTYPYATDMAVNPHTYSDIATEAVPHGVGSVFCAMIWDMYWDLVDAYGFDSDIYNGTGGNNIAMQLVIDGLKLQPCSPGFVDMRDAILQADKINNCGENHDLIWATFARRGLGYSAQQGSSASNTDGIEAFDLPPNNLPPDPLDLVVEKTSDVASADPGDVVTYTLTFSNTCDDLTDIEINDVLPADMTFVDGSATGGGTHSNGIITWPSITSLTAGSEFSYSYQATVNSDVEYSSMEIFSDDMENGVGEWQVSNVSNLSNWALISTAGGMRWFAEELEANALNIENQYLTLGPKLLNGITELSFLHKYDTEQNWDGGKVEISIDGANTWLDLGQYFTENGYNDYIEDSPGNAAFSGNSGTYITSRIDLTAFCGEEAYIRFNFYYDQSVDGRGWLVDDVVMTSGLAMLNRVEAITGGETKTAENCVRINGGETPTHNIEENNISASVYPNPNKGKAITLNIQSDNSLGDFEIKIFNAAGQLVFNENKSIHANTASFEILDQKLSAGLYTVQFAGKEFNIVEKFIVLN